MTYHALTTARVAHRANTSQIEFANKLISKGCTACSVEAVQYVEMFLHQLCSRESAEIEDLIVYGVDAVGADGNNYIAITRERFGNVVVSLKTRDRLRAVCRAWPLQ